MQVRSKPSSINDLFQNLNYSGSQECLHSEIEVHSLGDSDLESGTRVFHGHVLRLSDLEFGDWFRRHSGVTQKRHTLSVIKHRTALT